MSTRHQKTTGPLSQERYMSSPEFAELHGINGVAMSARSAVLMCNRKRNLLWFIQSMSLADGGLNRVARELLAMFPDRLVSADARATALKATSRNEYPFCDPVLSLPEFMVDLCINPRILFDTPGEDVEVTDLETHSAMDANPGLAQGDFKKARLPYFNDIISALFEYQKRHELGVRKAFQHTAISRKIWETLDFGLAQRSMVVLDGLEGRGKTESVKAWCAVHQGQARFVSLKGVSNKTTIFREIAKALGIASSYSRTAPEMQARIEDVLKRSKIMLVLDEAHFLFNQARRMYTRPELIDWIDTAVCNSGVPIALVTTPQFVALMTRAADQVEWNYRQFRRRVKRWIKLPAVNTEDDIRAVARSVFPQADAAAIKKITGYALLSKRDLSAIGDVAIEVRDILGTHDLAGATVAHVHQAIYERLLPSDQTFLEGMAEVRNAGRKGRPGRMVAPAPMLADLADTEAPGDDLAPELDGGRPETLPAPRRGGLESPLPAPRRGNMEAPETVRRAGIEQPLMMA